MTEYRTVDPREVARFDRMARDWWDPHGPMRALHKLKPFYPGMGPDWTAQGPLPGGDLGLEFEAFLGELVSRHPDLPPDYLRSLARRHGSHCERILQGAQKIADLGLHFGGQLRHGHWWLCSRKRRAA